MKTHYLKDEIKWLGCHNCNDKKGCQLKYEGSFVHSGIPEECQWERALQKKKVSRKKMNKEEINKLLTDLDRFMKEHEKELNMSECNALETCADVLYGFLHEKNT